MAICITVPSESYTSNCRKPIVRLVNALQYCCQFYPVANFHTKLELNWQPLISSKMAELVEVESVRTTSIKSGCKVKTTIAMEGDKIVFWNNTEHGKGAFLCRCRRNGNPARDLSNDEVICHRLLITYQAGGITIEDIPHTFASLKLGYKIPGIIQAIWDEDRRVWILGPEKEG